MIVIQVILIAAFLLMLLKFIANPTSYRAKAWQKILGILFFLLAVVAVLFPDLLNTMAHWVGVGRGTDMLLYILTLAFVFATINIYLKDQQEQRQIVRLSRRLAIIEAQQHPHNKRTSTDAIKQPGPRKKMR